jgi:uncharacterized protein YgiM (DUF1202 family)
MIARTLAWLCVITVAFPLAVAAQTTMPSEAVPSTQPAPPEPAAWTGVVTGTNVYVRSGPGEQAYPCTRLSSPDQVTVVGKTDGWLRIAAPKGCFSVINKTYVQPDAAGTSGTVTGDSVWVRAGGDLRTGNFIGVQRQLNRGDRVEIIGDAGEYFRITPPGGAYFYISERYVRPADAAAVGEMQALAAEHPELKAVPAAAATPSGPTQAAQLAAFKDAEKVLMEEFAKPLEKRDLHRALAAYQSVPVSQDDPLKLYVDARVAFVQQSLDEMADLEKVKELAKTSAEKQAEYEVMLERLRAVTPPPEPIRLPVARGVIQPSTIFPGTSAISKRYMVIDPQSSQTTAYVQSPGGDADLDKYVGMNVAIFGTSKFDVQLQRYVVDPEEIEVVSVGGTLPSPPKPVIRVRRPVTMPTTTAPAAPPKKLPVAEDKPSPGPVNESEYQ